MAAALIQVERLTKRYGSRRGIEDVSFEVHQGEVFGFLGPNGAGKTTTLRLLMGTIAPTAGQARILGRDVWRDAPEIHRSVAFLGSESGFLGEFTAARQLGFLARLRGLPEEAWRPLTERLDLDPSVAVRKLSRGNRQKIGVVSAFMGREPLLLLDEPTSGLDPLLQREFLSIVTEARADGRTILLSSHNLPEVERASDRVAIIREGRIVDISSVADLHGTHWRSVNVLLAEEAAPDAFNLPNVEVVASSGREVHLLALGDPNPLLRRLAALDVRDVSIATPDIEDVFLRFYDDGPAVQRPSGLAPRAGEPDPAPHRPGPDEPVEPPSEPSETEPLP